MIRPRSSVPLGEADFGRLKEKLGQASAALRGMDADPAYAPPLPDEVGLQLTNRCNLRCESCFQWNETGFHHLLPIAQQKDELPIGLVEKILAETRPARSKVFLWGGEPLVYRQWDALAGLLAEDPRWTVLCTNGIGIDRKIDSLLRISSELVCLISLDGFEEENDRIRGKNTFRRVMEGVDLLLDLRARGLYKGEVSISCVISAENCRRLVEFVEFFEDRGVNTVYFVFPWYIPDATADRMDRFFADRFPWLSDRHPELAGRVHSWHSYQFRVDPRHLEDLKAELRRLAERRWRVRVRLQPSLHEDEVEGFILGSEAPAQGRTRCLSVSARLNVLPDGRVTTCKLFPEFALGSLEGSSVAEIWNGDDFRRARGVFACGLMPICSKCVQLYLSGA